MGIRTKIDIDLVDVDADGIATSQSLAGAGSLTLDGALTSGGSATLDYARQVSITSAGNDSGITFTVTGTDYNDKALAETITGGNVAAVETTGYFKTVTDIAASGATAANVTAGTVDEASSHIVPLNSGYSDVAATLAVDLTGTINFTLQQTFDDLWAEVLSSQSAQWFDIAASQTADLVSAAGIGATGVRLIVNSYTSGAELQFYVAQPN